MSETRIIQTETRPRREVSASRETENETRREIEQFLKSKSKHFYAAWGKGGGGGRVMQTDRA